MHHQRTPWPVDSKGRPVRRIRIETGIYRSVSGKFEVCFTDELGKVRFEPQASPNISAARSRRNALNAAKDRGESIRPSPKLRFGDVADRWLAEQVTDLRQSTQDGYGSYVDNHLRPRWGDRPLDSIEVGDSAKLIRDLRAAGYAEWTISGIVRAGSRVFKFARRYCKWRGDNPFDLLENGERAKVSETPERRIYTATEFEQVLDATSEPWRTLFELARDIGGRESELLGLWWEDFDLEDLDAATIRFSHQVDRTGTRVPLKTEESKATLPLPRATALTMLKHKARSRHTGPKAYAFATRSGRPLGQRNVLRALYRAQERARTLESQPTFPELFEHDEHGRLVVDQRGRYVLRDVERKELSLPDFHALRHTAAMECDDAEEARGLLRHKNSNVTRAVYRAHFSDKEREALRARMEARMASRMERAHRGTAAQKPLDPAPNVAYLSEMRETA